MSVKLLNNNNLPTPKQEEWKYTNISRLVGGLKDIEPEVPQEIIVNKSEEILLVGEEGKHHQPRLKINIKDGAQATVIERHKGKGAYWKNMASEITLGKNARLNHVRILDDSIDSVQTNMVHITMDRDAYLNSFTINLGGKMTRHDIHAVLNGAGADCNINIANLLRGYQHGDSTILLEHIAPHCNSSQFCRTILDDDARGVFQSKTYVQKQAQKTYGRQLSNALMFSDKCEMDAKPELEIYADDVKFSHGATCGQLDSEPLFYLRSRGLSEIEAKTLIVQAFMGEVIDNIENEDLREEIKDKAEQWLKMQMK